MVFGCAYHFHGERISLRLGGRRVEQSVMFQCQFGLDANAEYERSHAVPAGPGSLNCGLVSGFGYAERSFQLRHGGRRI